MALHFNRHTVFALLKIALPMVISQGAFAVMIFTDRYFMAMISPTHMAAALGGGVAWYFSISLFNGILAYANALVAQYLGAQEFSKCSKVITQGLILSSLCIPVLMIIAIIFRGMFASMGHEAEQVVLEKSYYTILMIGAVLTLYKTCMASFFSGIAKTKVVMIADVLSIVLNIPLSYVLIFGHFGLPAMGIEGAAIGTVISTGFAISIFGGFYFSKSVREHFDVFNSFNFDKGICRRYIKLGLPSGMEVFLNVAAFNLFLLMFQSYGIVEAASAAIVFNWDVLSFVPLMGLNIAIMSLIGRFVGAGDMAKANEVTNSGYVLGIGYSFVLALIFLLFRAQLVEVFIFTEDEYSSDIRDLASFMMIGLATYVVAEGALQVAAGILRGAGDTKWIMYASVSLHWLMLIAQFFIIKMSNLGPKASWLAFVLMILGISAIFILRLRGNRWRDPEKLKQVMSESH